MEKPYVVQVYLKYLFRKLNSKKGADSVHINKSQLLKKTFPSNIQGKDYSNLKLGDIELVDVLTELEKKNLSPDFFLKTLFSEDTLKAALADEEKFDRFKNDYCNVQINESTLYNAALSEATLQQNNSSLFDRNFSLRDAPSSTRANISTYPALDLNTPNNTDPYIQNTIPILTTSINSSIYKKNQI